MDHESLLRAEAVTLAREIDVPAHRALAALRNLLAKGLIEPVAVGRSQSRSES